MPRHAERLHQVTHHVHRISLYAAPRAPPPLLLLRQTPPHTHIQCECSTNHHRNIPGSVPVPLIWLAPRLSHRSPDKEHWDTVPAASVELHSKPGGAGATAALTGAWVQRFGRHPFGLHVELHAADASLYACSPGSGGGAGAARLPRWQVCSSRPCTIISSWAVRGKVHAARIVLVLGQPTVRWICVGDDGSGRVRRALPPRRSAGESSCEADCIAVLAAHIGWPAAAQCMQPRAATHWAD